MGFFEEQEEILAAAVDHDSSRLGRAHRAGQRIRDRAIYLHSVLTTPLDPE